MEDELKMLFDKLNKERERQAANLNDAKASLRTLVSTIWLNDLLSSIGCECGNDISYQYPTSEELGISIEELASDQPAAKNDVDKKLMIASEDSKRRKGHLDFLLKTFGHDQNEIADLRNSANKLANEIIECYMRLVQIDCLTLPLLNVDPNAGVSIKQIADVFCKS